ncbi:hypothetical protein [Prochlorococcus marinus]|uniref:hypothetical protein n=1 Tax=Prochlorococcus marinus TaxID=1219 RepID=UPI0022B36117|nr:hypothetical protein [Prochlorococcus marinus]
MNITELGLRFKESLEKIPDLNSDQRIGLLASLQGSDDKDISIIRSVIESDGCLNLFTSINKNSIKKEKIFREIKRLSEIFSEEDAQNLCDFFKAFDPLFEYGIKRILSELETLKTEKKIERPKGNKDESPNFIKKLFKEGGTLYSIISLIIMYISAQWVELNLRYLFNINYDGTSPWTFRFIGAAGWIGAGLIIVSILFFFAYSLSIEPSNNKDQKLRRFEERRKNSKPWLIGVLVACVSPLIASIVYAIRQRSWQMVASIIWIIFCSNFLIFAPFYPRPLAIKFSTQIICGVAVYFIARKNKLEFQTNRLEEKNL